MEKSKIHMKESYASHDVEGAQIAVVNKSITSTLPALTLLPMLSCFITHTYAMHTS